MHLSMHLSVRRPGADSCFFSPSSPPAFLLLKEKKKCDLIPFLSCPSYSSARPCVFLYNSDDRGLTSHFLELRLAVQSSLWPRTSVSGSCGVSRVGFSLLIESPPSPSFHRRHLAVQISWVTPKTISAYKKGKRLSKRAMSGSGHQTSHKSSSPQPGPLREVRHTKAHLQQPSRCERPVLEDSPG